MILRVSPRGQRVLTRLSLGLRKEVGFVVVDSWPLVAVKGCPLLRITWRWSTHVSTLSISPRRMNIVFILSMVESLISSERHCAQILTRLVLTGGCAISRVVSSSSVRVSNYRGT